MTILITGGEKCGKSHIAEDFLNNAENKFYIATMQPYGEEAQKAIDRHRKMREGKGFTTIEQSRNISEIKLPKGCSVLVECISTLTANEMFSDEDTNGIDIASKITSDIRRLSETVGTLVLVTNDVGCDGGVDDMYSPETAEYIKVIGEINRRLAELSDTVIEAVYGIPVVLKGALT